MTNLYYIGISACRKAVIPDNLFECNYGSYSLLMERCNFIGLVAYNVALTATQYVLFQ